MTTDDVLRRRLATQRLTGEPFERPAEMVRWLTAVQSQEYGYARWSVGQRVGGGTDAAVEAAYDAGHILRTHVLRPTWHFVTPDDIRWLQELTGPRVHALNGHRYRALELDPALLACCNGLLCDALRDNSYLTRRELGAVLERNGISIEGQRLAYIVMHAELDGLICSGPSRGKQQTYALLAERAPQARTLPREEALAEFALRFFRGHGPVTVRDFARWSGFSLTEARTGLALVAERLVSETVDGHTLWFDPQTPHATVGDDGAFLLPVYDEAYLSYTELNFPAVQRPEAAPGWTEVFYQPLIIGLRHLGAWRRTVERRSVRLEIALYRALAADEAAALDAAVARYEMYMGMPVERC